MKKAVLDAADVRILSAVQQYGYLSKSRLAELVNLSPTPCWARLNRLVRAGLIRGYHADVAVELIADITSVVVTVSLNKHRKSDFERFEAFIRSNDAIIDCIATGGGMDYVMQVVTPSLASFQELMDSLLSAELGIDRYMTYFATRRIKSAQPKLSQLLAKNQT
jgi:Lrp/AsnC family transcriptional regulator, regulator of ectoine-degradation genes